MASGTTRRSTGAPAGDGRLHRAPPLRTITQTTSAGPDFTATTVASGHSGTTQKSYEYANAGPDCYWPVRATGACA
jgi:hypothetical protein